MAVVVNAKGLSCPEPVILTKKAIEGNDEVEVIVDNITALENIKRLALDKGCTFEVKEENGTYRIFLRRTRDAEIAKEKSSSINNSTIIVISSNTMGKGDEELGKLLLRAFVHTLTEIKEKPYMIILYNTGVMLAKEGSECLQDLKVLESAGVKIVICGTCVNHFGIKERIAVGTISNMYVIAEAILSAGRLVYP